MPELPEVQTYCEYLAHNLINSQIKATFVYVPKCLKNVNKIDFQQKLKHEQFQKINRYGKYLLLFLTKYVLIIHLRMEGKFFVNSKENRINNNLIIEWKLSDQKYLQFCDVRKFATIDLVNKNELENHSIFTKVGPDPFSSKLNVSYLHSAWKKRFISIKSALLEQKIMSGIGNIYACEILFACKIHPKTTTNSLTKKQVQAILFYAKKILTIAIKEGGTSVRSYYVNHKPGNYFHFLKVYGRRDKPCFICQTPIQKIQWKQRGTYFCPECQKN